MRVITDSAADLTPEQARELGITIVPLTIQFAEGEVSAADLTPDAFYERLQAAGKQIPSTATPAPASFEAIFRTLVDAGEEVLAIIVSSGLSGLLGVARLATETMPEGAVTLVDSLTLAGGQQFQAIAAALGVRRGWTREAILARLEAIRRDTEVVFTLETLEYLAHGGRIGRVEAIAGMLLHISPVIHVDPHDGRYTTVAKVRSFSKALDAIGGFLKSRFGNEPLWVIVQHGQRERVALDFADGLQRTLTIVRLDHARVSPILGVHTGPGIVGACAVPLRHFADLLP